MDQISTQKFAARWYSRLLCTALTAAVFLSAIPTQAQAPPAKFHDLTVGSFKFPLPSKMRLLKDDQLPDMRNRIWVNDFSDPARLLTGPLPGDIGVYLTHTTFSERAWNEFATWKAERWFEFKEGIKRGKGIKEVSAPVWKSQEERAALEKIWKQYGDPDATFGQDTWMVYEVLVNSGDRKLFTSGTVPYGGGAFSATTMEGSTVYRAVDVYIVSATDRSLYTIRMFGGGNSNHPPSCLLLSLAWAGRLK